jgi:alkanesulfonate monooxygenase SsuD/methylene tetrahydromethanopterin reductase-like flavin-dependent oxidoreductase (luciferase family)
VGELWFGLNVHPGADKAALGFRLASLADEHGLDFVSVMDHPEQPRFLETWTLLVALAMRTRRVAVMPNVASIPLRPPAMLAKAASSLALLTGGRVILGIGAGAPTVVGPNGGPVRDPGEAVDAVAEAVAVIRGVWDTRRERVSVQGRHYRLADARPGPHPPAPIPLWIGSFGPRLLRLTGRVADGWAPTNRYADPTQIARTRHHVDQGAEQAGRDPASIRRNYNVMGAIDPQAAAQDGKLLVGGVDAWVEALGRYHRELGFDSFVFWPVHGDELAQSRLFATEVVPQLRELTKPTPPAGSSGRRDR